MSSNPIQFGIWAMLIQEYDYQDTEIIVDGRGASETSLWPNWNGGYHISISIFFLHITKNWLVFQKMISQVVNVFKSCIKECPNLAKRYLSPSSPLRIAVVHWWHRCLRFPPSFSFTVALWPRILLPISHQRAGGLVLALIYVGFPAIIGEHLTNNKQNKIHLISLPSPFF